MGLNKKKINFLKEVKEKEILETENSKIVKLSNYIKSVYEKKIIDAIEKDCQACSIKITIPYKYQFETERESNLAQKALSDDFEKLDLTIKLHHSRCNCFLNFICNRNDNYVKIYF